MAAIAEWASFWTGLSVDCWSDLQEAGTDTAVVQAWLMSRDPVQLLQEVQAGQGRLRLTLQTQPGVSRTFSLQEGTDFLLPSSVRAQAALAVLPNGTAP